jgi:imidazoleglycerol-phosphate dehydratase/histidinol-phosphatase
MLLHAKPATGLLTKYIDNPAYDLQNSFVIGDRITDVELENLGAKGILSILMKH